MIDRESKVDDKNIEGLNNSTIYRKERKDSLSSKKEQVQLRFNAIEIFSKLTSMKYGRR